MSRAQRGVVVSIKGAMVMAAAGFLVAAIVNPAYTKYGGVIASFLLPFLADVVERVLKVRVSFRIQVVYLAFLFAALFLGIDMDFYRSVPGFDKVTHLVSGALSVIVGYYILRYFRQDKAPRAFRAVFLFCFCVMVGVLWEFFEFACDKFLGQSMQQLVSNGVDDTMFDLLAACAGSGVGIVVLLFNRQ